MKGHTNGLRQPEAGIIMLKMDGSQFKIRMSLLAVLLIKDTGPDRMGLSLVGEAGKGEGHSSQMDRAKCQKGRVIIPTVVMITEAVVKN